MSLRGFSIALLEEDALGSGVSDGNDTDGTTVVPTTLIRGCGASGRTTGFECGGGLADGRVDVGRGTTLIAEGTGVNSIGGWSPPMFATSGSTGAAS